MIFLYFTQPSDPVDTGSSDTSRHSMPWRAPRLLTITKAYTRLKAHRLQASPRYPAGPRRQLSSRHGFASKCQKCLSPLTRKVPPAIRRICSARVRNETASCFTAFEGFAWHSSRLARNRRTRSMHGNTAKPGCRRKRDTTAIDDGKHNLKFGCINVGGLAAATKRKAIMIWIAMCYVSPRHIWKHT